MNAIANINLVGKKVIGYWGVGAGWDYGVIVNEFSDDFGTDIVIEWEDGRQQQVDIKDCVEINEDTNIHSVGIYVDVEGKYLSHADDQITKEDNNQIAVSVERYGSLDDFDKLEALKDCFIDILVSLNSRTYGYKLLTDSEKQKVKTKFYAELDTYNIKITSNIIDMCKIRKFNALETLLSKYGYSIDTKSKFTKNKFEKTIPNVQIAEAVTHNFIKRALKAVHAATGGSVSYNDFSSSELRRVFIELAEDGAGLNMMVMDGSLMFMSPKCLTVLLPNG